MPNLDGTGPQGKGPMTGRGLGNCKKNNNQQSTAQSLGYGRGLGRGQGRGLGRGQGRGLGRGRGLGLNTDN